MSYQRNKRGQFLVPQEDYESLLDESCGICRTCGGTTGCCEPDARNYVCEGCGDSEVFGLEELLLMGRLVLVDGDGDDEDGDGEEDGDD